MKRLYVALLLLGSSLSFDASAWILIPGSLISAAIDATGVNDCPKNIIASLKETDSLATQDQLGGVGKGWLIIHGGGKITQEQKNCFTTLAGGQGSSFIAIPTALRDDEINMSQLPRRYKKLIDVDNITILHTRNKEDSNSDSFVNPIKNANGIFIDGGRQWRLVDSYLNTEVEKQIKAALNRGAVVMGSSAGASIQSSFLVRGMPGNSKNLDGDNTVMIFPGYTTGFGLLPNSAIDQHVDARGREGDLRQVIGQHPELLGVGIDQDAAIIVHQNKFYVVGGSVTIWSMGANSTLSPIKLNSGQGYVLPVYSNSSAIQTQRLPQQDAEKKALSPNKPQTSAVVNAIDISTLPPCQGGNFQQWNNCLGTHQYPNGNTYTGEYQHGKRVGNGFMDVTNKECEISYNCIGSSVHSQYRGSFKNDRIEGYGTWVSDDGEKYIGEFLMNLPNGKGSRITPSGTLNGQFKDGKYIGL
jgi:cyanophycinase